MVKEEFEQLLQAKADSDLLGPCLRDAGVPWVFEPQPLAWDSFRQDIGRALSVEVADIAVVGSGRFGFSLKPGNNFRAFRDKSDIDVVVVNAALFDYVWYQLLDAVYPRPPLSDQLGGWLKERRNELYTGWLSPLDIRLDVRIFGKRVRPLLDFNANWFDTFKRASRHPPRRHEDISSRLYRSWRHAELYHLHSLAALRRALRG